MKAAISPTKSNANFLPSGMQIEQVHSNAIESYVPTLRAKCKNPSSVFYAH